VAISNGRLLEVHDGQVTFRWRDSANGNQQKLMTLDAVEFPCNPGAPFVASELSVYSEEGKCDF